MGHAGQHKNTHKTYGRTKKVTLKATSSSSKPRKTAKLRESITPGTVLILLAGRYRGRRAVFLKQLESGLLLITGPWAVNKIPLRRVNQRYCIATSHKIDLKGADYSSVSDEWFKREGDDKKKKAKKSESAFFATETEKKGISEEKKAEQKSMDEPVVNGLSQMEKVYLRAYFSLSDKMYPHELKF
uniref:60S ribosomal protein L6 n=1 Tax=Pyrodinium bahamense TaxID=73915 RepID=A0A7S0FQI7_9DINO|mmetsp:Transcript_40911/g.113748  ORF Transcript_40911/g.113748 Transcript_40911/m.113748 type:complete len:186 (+) Transcript_40911:78-635(+)|eukprot:CAMPEP_0179057842 /NCGR_PEP_ID=MMETSP0796-20121207/24542_1 /TAXON_ID=73915 /ORGANISM="Pyrodinium bahamense, Strain pbaha01" /LENGTH=185 /DNA_ID=CAMNT_0020754573 /DNA_START=77 /DNA_END=634 /DNA_ORIENTATION=+